MILDVDQLLILNQTKRLRLATTIGVQGWVTVDDDPDKAVVELLRLAKMGQRMEAVRLGLIQGGKP